MTLERQPKLAARSPPPDRASAQGQLASPAIRGFVLGAMGVLSTIAIVIAALAARMVSEGSRDPWDYGGIALGAVVVSVAAIVAVLVARARSGANQSQERRR